jgi:hypothetical protein
MRKNLIWVFVVLHLLFSLERLAHPKEKSRSKSIDFDGDLIEGMNKRPLDSLNQISESDRKRKRPHLYHKKTHFRPENAKKINEMRYLP